MRASTSLFTFLTIKVNDLTIEILQFSAFLYLSLSQSRKQTIKRPPLVAQKLLRRNDVLCKDFFLKT